MSQITIRPAVTAEAAALSALCFRSKAHWGYDANFMAKARGELTIAPELIATGHVLVAVDGGGRLLGIASVAPLARPGEFDLVHMFVEPGVIGGGAGRALFHAVAAMAKAHGGRTLVIQADPNAAQFYRRMGAVDAGDAPSDSIPGRRLPVLHYALAER
jgi:GNAT superfamily N-acetyltransferase